MVANIDNLNIRCAHENDTKEFMHFGGITQAAEFRPSRART